MLEEIKSYLFENYKIHNGEIKRKDGSRKVLKEHELVTELSVYADSVEKDWSRQVRIDGVAAWKKSIETAKSQPKENSVGKFIAKALLDNDIVVTNSGDFIKEKLKIEESEVLTVLEADLYDWNREFKENIISPTELKAKLQKLKFDKQFSVMQKIIDTLRYSKENEKDLNEFLELTYKTLKIQQSYEIFRTIFCHWLWMVKRKLNNQKTKNQIFLNFYGKPATGKSTFVNIFTKPFSDFRIMNANLDELCDVRCTPALGKNLIHFVDEMKASKKVYVDSDLNILKSIITQEEDLTYRLLGTNYDLKISPKTSLISCTNFRLCDILNDSTGMRRFFELTLGLESHEYVESDFRLIENLVIKAWKGIDESNDIGYLDTKNEIGKEIMKIQDSYVRKTAFELWKDSIEIEKGKQLGKVAYDMYVEYCEGEGLDNKIKTISMFYSALRGLGFNIETGHGGKMYMDRSITVKQNSTETHIDSILVKSKYASIDEETQKDSIIETEDEFMKKLRGE